MNKRKFENWYYKVSINGVELEDKFRNQREISQRFGISQGTISNILKKKHKNVFMKIEKINE